MAEQTIARRAWVEQIMGMPISVHVRGRAAIRADTASAVMAVFAELREVEMLLSPYRAHSQVGLINQGLLFPSDYHPVLRKVIDLCEQARDRTHGYFTAVLPQPNGGTRFDPSGLVKGWAVERAARHLDGYDFCLNAGGDMVLGEDLSREGHAEGRVPWRIGIEDPADPTRTVAVLELSSGAIATSGGARRGAHIRDPRTGEAAAGLSVISSVTVVGPSLTWADVYATASVVAAGTRVSLIDTLLCDEADYHALVISADGRVSTTAGWPGELSQGNCPGEEMS